ncbi:protein kinase [Aspergillus campestris IBT 28561]|uniref:Protein kinase n=1 Tax=Aspergillus campestris (strain IBT 28561) TaxID=1392248 RepID=A0A2I1DGF2_ASPC2|nr:protein kinase [Aspergillus campestris IBT 28561]PKY08949.1 protein kinase [Aspergillus campestris IBT 28561]
MISPKSTMFALRQLPRAHFPPREYLPISHSSRQIEETLPLYGPENYYPVYTGEVFVSRYQVVCKLGYGTSSTAWLCRDLEKQRFITLKVCVQGRAPDHEIKISRHLNNAADHAGKSRVRLVLDSFEIIGPHGKHTFLVYQPLGMTFTELRDLLPDNIFPEDLLIQRGIQLVLISLVFIHENNVIHTDISPNNILHAIDNDSLLSRIEDDETTRPVARKVLPDHTIYFSRPMPPCTGLPVLSDFGEARVGSNKHRGDIMPGVYRAPEVILGMEWDSSVDVWSTGMMTWDLVENSHLFFAKRDHVLSDEQHLAEMVSLMGPPPPEFLKRSERCDQFRDANGTWKSSLPIPKQSLETRAQRFTNTTKDNTLFLNFMRRILR